MKKFTNLLKKEIRELVTKQLVISLLFTMALFYFIGEHHQEGGARRPSGDPDDLRPRPGRLRAVPRHPARAWSAAHFKRPRPGRQDQGPGHRRPPRTASQGPARHPARASAIR